jgi:hypothetical protein
MIDDVFVTNIRKEFGVIFEMLTNPKDKERLINAVKEMSNSMTRMDAERDHQKNIVDKVYDETGIDKKYIKKLSAIYHRQTFAQVQTEREELEGLYEELFG